MGPWMESSEACAKATIELSPATSPASMQRSTDHSIPEELPVAARKLQEAVSDDLAAMGGIAASQAVTAVA